MAEKKSLRNPSSSGGTETAIQAEVARRTQQLQAALDETTTLLHDVDHRSKNNLQSLASLAVLKARRVKDPTIANALRSMAERIGAVATVQRLIYAEDGATWFDLREFLTDLPRDLVVANQPADVELSLDLANVALSAMKAAPIALLVNELIGNALRHAFPQGRGRLSVSSRFNGDLCIVVEDDGLGLASHRSPEGAFGKDLIDMLARQLRGAVAWEDAAPGTRAVLVIPLAEQDVKGALSG